MTLLFVMLIKLIYARSNKGNIHKQVSQDINYMNKRKTFQINIICIYNSTMICNIHDYIKGRSWWLLCKIYSSYFSRIRLSCIENKTRLELQRRCKLTTVNVQRIMEFLLFTFHQQLYDITFKCVNMCAVIKIPSQSHYAPSIHCLLQKTCILDGRKRNLHTLRGVLKRMRFIDDSQSVEKY